MARPLASAPTDLTTPVRDLPRRGDDAGAVVVEGVEAVRWLLQSPLLVRSVFAKEATAVLLAAEIEARAVPCFTGTRAELAELVGFAFDRGVVAWAERPTVPALDPHGIGQALVLDAVHDPANVGALIRSARCLGIDTVVLTDGCADPWYRRAVRVSVGHVFHVQLQQADDAVDAIHALQAAGATCIAAHRGPDASPVGTEPVAGPWALVVGNEDRGLRPALAAACDRRCYIPMADGVDSLNVGVAGGIMLAALAQGWCCP